MKLWMPRRWRKSAKSTNPTSIPTNPVDYKPQTSRIIYTDHIHQALETVRASQAPPGEQYALTILEHNEELVAWMRFTGYKMSSPASSERRNVTTDGFPDWRSAEITASQAGGTVNCRRSEPTSAVSEETVTTNDSGRTKFGKSGIEISGSGMTCMQAPRAQVSFRPIDWNPPPT